MQHTPHNVDHVKTLHPLSVLVEQLHEKLELNKPIKLKDKATIEKIASGPFASEILQDHKQDHIIYEFPKANILQKPKVLGIKYTYRNSDNSYYSIEVKEYKNRKEITNYGKTVFLDLDETTSTQGRKDTKLIEDILRAANEQVEAPKVNALVTNINDEVSDVLTGGE